MAAAKAQGHWPGGLWRLFPERFFTALSTMWSDQLFHCHTCHQDPCCLHRDRIEPILPMSPLPCSPVCADFYSPDCKHPSSATNQCHSGPAGKLRFAQPTPGPSGPALAQAQVAITVPLQAGTSCWWTPCLQEADLVWSSGVRHNTLPHPLHVPKQQHCPFPDWGKLSSMLCLLPSVSGREGALEKTHEPVAGPADGRFSCAPPKDSFSSQRNCSVQGTGRKAEQQMALLSVRGTWTSVCKGHGCTWEEWWSTSSSCRDF